MLNRLFPVLIVAALAAPGAGAQAPVPGMPGMAHGAAAPAPGAAPSGPPGAAPAGSAANHRDMVASMERMNADMMAPQAMAGDADQNLVAMMIPHHQGAIDMARIYLREGRDPAIRRMAQRIIADQEREIREMRAWQARHPAPSR